jgi:hypothetical protein
MKIFSILRLILIALCLTQTYFLTQVTIEQHGHDIPWANAVICIYPLLLVAVITLSFMNDSKNK